MEPKQPDPVSGIQPIPLDVTAKQSDAERKAGLDRLREATNKTITSACELSREARSASRASDKTMRAVRPGEPIPDGDVTERFEAIRANVK